MTPEASVVLENSKSKVLELLRKHPNIAIRPDEVPQEIRSPFLDLSCPYTDWPRVIAEKDILNIPNGKIYQDSHLYFSKEILARIISSPIKPGETAEFYGEGRVYSWSKGEYPKNPELNWIKEPGETATKVKITLQLAKDFLGFLMTFETSKDGGINYEKYTELCLSQTRTPQIIFT